MVFLHGVLYLEVIEGKDFPDVDTTWFSSEKDVSDTYVTVDIYAGGKETCRIAKTSIINNNLSPKWNEKFRVSMCHESESILFKLKDKDLISLDHMGSMSISTEGLVSEEKVTGFFPVLDADNNPAGSLNISVQYKSVESIIGSNEVLDTVYPMRAGCKVKLYQDAHTPNVPPISDVPGPEGGEYNPPQLWIDTIKAIKDAQKIIYVVGWSVKANITLDRDDPEAELFGDLLKRKADEGVRVLVMVWNEAFTTDVYTPKYLPVTMGTNDEETRQFFEGTDVEVFLAPRQKNNARWSEATFVSTCYTHHQKCVILDAEAEGEEKRRLIAFMGGVDLTNGRYDTPEHSLFKTLPSLHKDDFYNGCCPSTVTQGPRQPWHDIHCLVEGQVAHDFMQNFIDRWRFQANDRENRLYNITEDEFIMDWESSEENSWNVQLFRSINSDSCSFDSSILDNLVARKGRIYDNSIQNAYIHHIRRAKHYIYIENQYFLGSSHGWLFNEAKCPHLIPNELAARIIKAINDKEDFRVYVVIPMHPEGDPSAAAMQEILHWQHRTMEMMYHKIAKAIKLAEIDAHPTDYLGFFCPAKRESPDDVPDCLEPADVGTVSEKAREHMRFMIYVHSKMAIFDDEYIIIGSANINERSMSGNRDSEMVVGAFQPNYTKEKLGNEIPGDVRSFRLALWAEHTGAHVDYHLQPWTLDCMQAMRKQGEENLVSYIDTTPVHNDSHLLVYPNQVTQDGDVKERDDISEFPDTNAKISGAASFFLPNKLTT